MLASKCGTVLLEDREYPLCSKSHTKDLLRDFQVAEYIPEIADCDNQADRMRQYLSKNGVKTGYLKVANHMLLVGISKKENLFTIDPGTKKIRDMKTAQYVAWWI